MAAAGGQLCSSAAQIQAKNGQIPLTKNQPLERFQEEFVISLQNTDTWDNCILSYAIWCIAESDSRIISAA
ncbi:hypothetical protein Y1Q_0005829 [Alligator mississippiensis]|uniref:Uncharacterized protein n=1 Tax=Alligator mississippiensis TaxID=8496 RepID=A0A151MG24_ALLMI|nr:hypothetical protein Y1Q_0005829 [Alligator mississippiensis]